MGFRRGLFRSEIKDAEGINDGLKRYSDKYVKKRKISPSIDDHPYAIEFFPSELYKVMGVDEGKKKKLLTLSKLRNSKEVLESLENDDIGKSMLERLKNIAEDENEDTNTKEDVPEFEENDDEFDDEDDDDDYNAEKYFDDGEDFGDADDFDDEAAF